ncbi:hypothetical protein [Candidatus Bathycorpusculum sp.]|uniref:hypothetical protein n=1 Tax=Candidatus Bathycorpusculum sp. TaxID=2994959 RepID=UPI00281FFACA|nr:hypothetical protein [Candidatus Termitimicrobium sp.]MCL2432846.1 hypothetical protein [Candidatus Termitimicrobium sp.]
MKWPQTVKRFYTPEKYNQWVDQKFYILSHAQAYGCSTPCYLHYALMPGAWAVWIYDPKTTNLRDRGTKA